MKYNGICGSDLEAYRGTRQPEFMSFPMRLGHEVSGTIDKVGSQVLGVVVGDKVATRYVWGALAEYIVCKPFNVIVLPVSGRGGGGAEQSGDQCTVRFTPSSPLPPHSRPSL